MFNRIALSGMVIEISALMTAHRDLLVELDQVNGDGDLGISMDDGFRALAHWLADESEDDLGQLLRQSAKVFNEAAPSSLGTIISFGLMGMAKALRGQAEVDCATAAHALDAGVRNIMDKAGAKPGEKTIVDALVPGATALVDGAAGDPVSATSAAAEAAHVGSEATRDMVAVHGRAAYSAERSIGILDGGSVVGSLIFRGVAGYVER